MRVPGVKEWIDALDASQPAMSAYDATVGLPPRPLGWKSEAQALGYTTEHPLDAAFVEPIVVMRQDDDLRDWVEQTEYQERRQVEHLVQLQAATEDGERRSLMNRLWPKSRGSCHYFFGGDCPYAPVCWSVNAEMGADPLASGQFRRRVPNHPMEKNYNG